MQCKHLTSLSIALCTAFSSAAMAVGGDITFKGQVVANTCVPNLDNTGAASGDVILNAVTVDDLPTVGATAAMKSFKISLTGCATASVPHIIKAYFWQPNATAGRLNKTSGTGDGWQYQILPANALTQLTVSNSSTVPSSGNLQDSGVDVSATGAGDLTYRVRYYRIGDLTEGTMDATATYVLFSN